ncbi:MAG: alpha/beta hydrolase [Chloroflexi bacterium]|nr:alpha/beta hydrolase [Chloroflexota bacterium]
MMQIRVLLAAVFCLLTITGVSAQATPRPVTPQDLADPDGQFVEINGVSVYYRTRGPEDGPPVLLLHGFLGSTVNWDDTLGILADAGYRAVAFDRPPFGLSDKRPELDYSLEAQAAITAGLMDELGIESAVLVGHSQGGAVIAQFALAYPERVEKLVFVAGAVGLTGEDYGADDQDPGQMFDFMRNADPDSPVARLALRALFTSSFARDLFGRSITNTDLVTPEMIERSSAYLRLEGWEAGLLAFARDGDLRGIEADRLTSVEVPALLLWGEADRLVPVSVGERLRDALPNATWITYPDVGHIPMLEAKQQFHADLLAFLSGA